MLPSGNAKIGLDEIMSIEAMFQISGWEMELMNSVSNKLMKMLSCYYPCILQATILESMQTHIYIYVAVAMGLIGDVDRDNI